MTNDTPNHLPDAIINTDDAETTREDWCPIHEVKMRRLANGPGYVHWVSGAGPGRRGAACDGTAASND